MINEYGCTSRSSLISSISGPGSRYPLTDLRNEVATLGGQKRRGRSIKLENPDALTSLDLKSVIVSAGVRYPREVYEAVSGWARLEPPDNAFACNCLNLPGDVAVHLTLMNTPPSVCARKRTPEFASRRHSCLRGNIPCRQHLLPAEDHRRKSFRFSRRS